MERHNVLLCSNLTIKILQIIEKNFLKAKRATVFLYKVHALSDYTPSTFRSITMFKFRTCFAMKQRST